MKPTAVSGTAGFGLLMVKVKGNEFTTVLDAAPNDLLIAGGAITAGTTVTTTVEVLPAPPFVEVTATLLLCAPVAVPVTLTEKVQEEPPAIVAEVSDTLPDPATAVIVPPPQLPARPLGVDTTKPAGRESVNATPVRGTPFGLLIVKLRVVVPPTPMDAAPNTFVMTGGVGLGGGAGRTVTEATDVLPVPPSEEPTVALLVFTPVVVAVTFTEKVQDPLPATLPPAKDMLPEPAIAVIVPAPQLPVRPLGVATTRPAGRVSVNAMPVSGVSFGSLTVNVLVVKSPTPRLAAPNDTVMVGGATKIGLHWAAEMLLVSRVTAPSWAKARPAKVEPLFTVMLVSARTFPANEVLVPKVAELPICQKTLQTVPPLIMFTDELLAVVSALPI